MIKNLAGVFPVAVTPFTKEGKFDFDAAKKHLDWLIDSGVHGLCILGATGEYLSISNEEHKEYVREIVPYVADRVPVIVGVTRERPDEVIDLMRNAQKYGASAAMVLSPYYCHPNQEEIYENYRYITENCDLPIMIYNNPGSASVDINHDTLKKLFQLKNAVLMKESTGDIKRTTEAVLMAPSNINVFCGCDALAMESFLVGTKGWISMMANVAPKDCIALYEAAAIEHDIPKAKEIYKKLLPGLYILEEYGKSPQILKYILKKEKGLNMGYCRRPRMELTDEDKAYIDANFHADKLS